MARPYQQGDEPVRGYRLVRFLGKGGFGEVWQASGPGGTEVAFKIIPLSEKPGQKELRAIELVKKIRHPNLVPILAMWVRDRDEDAEEEPNPRQDRPSWPARRAHTLHEFALSREKAFPEALFLAMGLGDKSLLERFKECKEEGFSGIPPAELLGYLEDAARALDHLNSPRHDLGQGQVAIQHCDIKPQNILIVGGAAQVCDFGLARVLGESRTASHPGVTPAFAAPEMLESGQPSPYSDQYSLAVTYHYLRTGALPFSQNEANVVLTETLEGRLDLSRLPAAEQQVIRRATSRQPLARFTNCCDMVRELRLAMQCSPAEGQGESLVIEPGSEIVPGHRLKRLIGRGAYGEVWEAQGPGCLPLALKIIKDLDRASGRGRQEFRALEIIQQVAHNGLMELRAYWTLDRHGQLIPDAVRGLPGAPVAANLVIATRLANRTMTQLLEQYRDQGRPGIPPRELFGYLRQVAAALDYLNAPIHVMGDRTVSIQHRDVKPDNIMLANDVVKLTDFGLAKVMESEERYAEIRQDSVGFTFHYAAPEVLRGKVTRWSDQYSLAITYFQLRTGCLPYGPECSAYDQMMRQLEGQLDLHILPLAERRVVVRATHVTPEERFPSCAAFIEALAGVVPNAGILLEPNPDFTLDEATEAAAEHPSQHRLELVSSNDNRLRVPAPQVRSATPPVSFTGRAAKTMQVILAENEVYPAPVDDLSFLGETPQLSDTDHEGPELPIEDRVEPREDARTKTHSLEVSHYWPLALVFILGIGMAVLVHFALKFLMTDAAIQGQLPTNPIVPAARSHTIQPAAPVTQPRIPSTLPATVHPVHAGERKPLPPLPDMTLDLLPAAAPVQPVLLIFGRNPRDPDFEEYLASTLDQLIATQNKPEEFARAERELAQIPRPLVSAKLLAFRAECQMEAASPNVPQAETLLNQAVQLAPPTAYVHYLQARYCQATHQPLRALPFLEEALKADLSLRGFRLQRVLAMLDEIQKSASGPQRDAARYWLNTLNQCPPR